MINSSLIKELREISGAGIMECKKALIEAQGNLEKAREVLKLKGYSSVMKKSNRVATEGIVAAMVSDDNKMGVLVEVNSETDFLARNEKFQNLVKKICIAALQCNNIEDLHKMKLSSGQTVKDEVIEISSITGEKLELSRMAQLKTKKGIIGSYVHNAVSPGLGRIAALVIVNTELVNDDTSSLAKDLAMHITARNPKFLQASSIPNEIISQEILKIKQNSLEEVSQKLLDEQIASWIEEVTLLEQVFIKDGKNTISNIILNLEQKLKTTIRIENFVRFSL